MVYLKSKKTVYRLGDNMKYKNFEGTEYNVNYVRPPVKFKAQGLCENPDLHEYPSISVDPELIK